MCTITRVAGTSDRAVSKGKILNMIWVLFREAFWKEKDYMQIQKLDATKFLFINHKIAHRTLLVDMYCTATL